MKITLSRTQKKKPKACDLVFGQTFTDHMFVMNYVDGKFDDGAIVPFSPLEMSPATTVMHYGQGIFEGMKAYRNLSDEISLFRPMENFERLNRSADIMCMPNIDTEKVLKALMKLLEIEKEWIPTEKGTSLYIRPYMFGADPTLGVHASHTYKFIIVLCPVGAYYKNGLQPTKIFVEEKYVRASIGGTGEAKCIGNYGGTLRAGAEAGSKGYDQVLWLDAKDRKYVEEVGAMNIFFVINGEVVTPELCGSILHGITRKSSIELLRSLGYKVSEKRISIDEVIDAIKSGELTESFGSGTAAVISPVGLLGYKGVDYEINKGVMGEITKTLYDKLSSIQTGKIEDNFGWRVIV